MANQRKSAGGRRAPHANPIRVATPGENDILCGKDRACALHPGSQKFRTVIDSYRATYQKATTKYDKMQITKEIYEVLSQDARFLKFNDKNKLWEEITPLAGRDKIGHALRFANNHSNATKVKKPRRAVKRQNSFSSTSATSATSSAIPAPTKAELVKNIVEAVKEEPKVWDSLVDHLTLQDALTTVPGDVPPSAEAAAAHHQRVASIVDPVALENIAYAVESKADDAALDDLICLLNNEEIVTEEDLQSVLAAATGESIPEEEIPPTIDVTPNESSRVEGLSEAIPYPEPLNGLSEAVAYSNSCNSTNTDSQLMDDNSNHHSTLFRRASSRRSGKNQHSRGYSVDDDMWSVMKEPILDMGEDDWQ